VTIKVTHLLKPFRVGVLYIYTVVDNDKVSTDSASRGPSAIAELLVSLSAMFTLKYM